MAKIKMLKNTLGSPDGITVIKYKKDEIYELNESLTKTFVKRLKVAEYIKDKQIQEKIKEIEKINKKEIEVKNIKKAPKNKVVLPQETK